MGVTVLRLPSCEEAQASLAERLWEERGPVSCGYSTVPARCHHLSDFNPSLCDVEKNLRIQLDSQTNASDKWPQVDCPSHLQLLEPSSSHFTSGVHKVWCAKL